MEQNSIQTGNRIEKIGSKKTTAISFAADV